MGDITLQSLTIKEVMKMGFIRVGRASITWCVDVRLKNESIVISENSGITYPQHFPWLSDGLPGKD